MLYFSYLIRIYPLLLLYPSVLNAQFDTTKTSIVSPVLWRDMCEQDTSFSQRQQWLAGIDVEDIYLIHAHLAGILPFSSRYQYLAADIENKEFLSSGNALHVMNHETHFLLRLLLGQPISRMPEQIWMRLDSNMLISSNQYSGKTSITVLPVSPDWQGPPNQQMLTPVWIKKGDVNNSHVAENRKTIPDQSVTWAVPYSRQITKGEYIIIPVQFNGPTALRAFQAAFHFNADIYEFKEIGIGDMENWSKHYFYVNPEKQGEFRCVWWEVYDSKALQPGQILFYLTLRAKHDIPASDQPIIDIDETNLPARAWLTDGTPYLLRTVALPEASFDRTSAKTATQSIQAAIVPNPSAGAFRLQVQSERQINRAVLAVFDGQGSRLMRKELSLQPGNNEFLLSESERWPAGVYLWKIKSGELEAEGRVVRE
jgi:hypothetical protein